VVADRWPRQVARVRIAVRVAVLDVKENKDSDVRDKMDIGLFSKKGSKVL